MKGITFEDAQAEFDSMMDILRHDPITITKNGKDLTTLYPSQKVMEVAEALLEENLLNSVKKGEMNVLEALVTQNRSVDWSLLILNKTCIFLNLFMINILLDNTFIMFTKTVSQPSIMTVDNIPTNWVETVNSYLSEPMRRAVTTWEIDLLTAITEQAKIYEHIDTGMQQVEQGLTIPADKVVENIIFSIEQKSTTI